MLIHNFFGHLGTVLRHRHKVMEHCFKAGIIRRGLLHDLSKFSPTEFLCGVRYYQGTRSPNEMEREIIGYSKAWMHHKGRNRHHYEYWTDLSLESREYESVHMPRRYLVEMVMDRIAACKVYQGDKYTPGSALTYLERSLERNRMHPETVKELTYILTMLRDEGEDKTFRYLKKSVLKGRPFPWEEA